MEPLLTLRTARASDIISLSALAIDCYTHAFGYSFTPADLAAHLAKHLSPTAFAQILAEDVVILAELGGRLVGYVQFGMITATPLPQTDQELRRLYVHPTAQSRGYGSALMDAALRHPQLHEARRIYLDVWEHNHAAQRFYRRYGFAVVGTRSFQVESGAETSLDLVMVRESAPS
jgi:diamine N-acetyltransferase